MCVCVRAHARAPAGTCVSWLRIRGHRKSQSCHVCRALFKCFYLTSLAFLVSAQHTAHEELLPWWNALGAASHPELSLPLSPCRRGHGRAEERNSCSRTLSPGVQQQHLQLAGPKARPPFYPSQAGLCLRGCVLSCQTFLSSKSESLSRWPHESQDHRKQAHFSFLRSVESSQMEKEVKFRPLFAGRVISVATVPV